MEGSDSVDEVEARQLCTHQLQQRPCAGCGADAAVQLLVHLLAPILLLLRLLLPQAAAAAAAGLCDVLLQRPRSAGACCQMRRGLGLLPVGGAAAPARPAA